MGMQAEFNWYIVIRDDNLFADDVHLFQKNDLVLADKYFIEKTNYRIYPMDTPLPLIYNDKCLAMVSVTDLQWKCNSTQLLVQVVIKLTSDDPVALYYENSFREYKKEQQAIDD
jgi:hypothetical protein